MLRVACVQMEGGADRLGKGATAARLVARAADAGAERVVLPERSECVSGAAHCLVRSRTGAPSLPPRWQVRSHPAGRRAGKRSSSIRGRRARRGAREGEHDICAEVDLQRVREVRECLRSLAHRQRDLHA